MPPLFRMVVSAVVIVAVMGCRSSPGSPGTPAAVTPSAPSAPTATGPAGTILASPSAVPRQTPATQGGTIPVLPTATPVKALGATPQAIGSSGKTSGNGEPFQPYVLFNEKFVEGLSSQGDMDVEDVDSVFRYLFGRLPEQVTVYPSENYYYFIFNFDGRQFWGNMRLPSGRRENGVLSFAYFEFIDFPSVPGQGLTRAKFYTEADGLLITEVGKLIWDVRFRGKTVRFNLHPLRTDPPESFDLGPDEEFVERTFDESGYQFFLLFNKKNNYFFWVLNEEEIVPDTFETLSGDILVGVRSGFAFWVDKAHKDRKVLATIRSISVTRNDYYDGPFDQLADNYVDVNNVSKFMERAYPGLVGRIDRFGYHTDTERGTRVAISAYGSYFTKADILSLVARAKELEDPIWHLSRGGFPLPTTPTPLPPTPTPTIVAVPTG